MPKNIDRDIFDFCEKKFEELQKQDNGYHPQKHDRLVFENAAKVYNVSLDEVEKIFDRITKLSARIEMERINRLPKNKRNDAMMRKMIDIVRNNHDLPYSELEGEPSEPLKPHNEIIIEEYETMINDIALQGWTLPLSFDISNLDKLNKLAKAPNELEKYFEVFYSSELFNEMVDYITEHIYNMGQKTRFEECINIYKEQLYSSCLTVLTTILEGLISTFGDDPKDVRVMRICSYHEKEELQRGNRLKSLYWKSIHAYTIILFEKNDFSSIEPNNINRHWLIHGRTMKTSEKMDCLRMFNAISTMASLIENQNQV